MNFRENVAPYLNPETLKRLTDQGSYFKCRTVPFDNPFESFSGFADWSRDMALKFKEEEERKAAETVRLNDGYKTVNFTPMTMEIKVNSDTITEISECFKRVQRSFAALANATIKPFNRGFNLDSIVAGMQAGAEQSKVIQHRNKILACADDRFTIVDQNLCPQEKSKV